MTSKKPPDTEKTITEAPPAAKPFDTDEKTVHVVPGTSQRVSSSAQTLNVVLAPAKAVDPAATVDGLPGTSNPTLPSMTMEAPSDRALKPQRPAATIDEPADPARSHDTLDDPPAPLLARVSEVELMLPPSSKLPEASSGNSLDAVAPLLRRVLDKRVVAGLPIVLALGLTIWLLSAPDAPAPAQLEVVPPPASLPSRVEPTSPPAVDSSGVFVEVSVGGKIERRPGGKVKLISNPPTNVSTLKGVKLGRTPTEVVAEVGPLDLLFDNHELGITKAVTIDVRPGLGGKETIDFGRGWLDIDAPAGSKVLVDGKALGTAPVTQQTLFEGRHTVTVIGPEGWRSSRQISVVAGQTISHLVATPR